MAITTIFPHFPTDVGEGILYYLKQCPRALVDLSGTHWFAYNKLGNGTYFQQLFAEQDPLLAKTDRVFCQLKLCYPECCWKVACCTLLKVYTPFTMEFLERPFLEQQEALEKGDLGGQNAIEKQLVDAKRFNRLGLLVDLYFAKNAEGFMCDEEQLNGLGANLEGLVSSGVHCLEDMRISLQMGFSWYIRLNLILGMVDRRCESGVPKELWAEELTAIISRLLISTMSFKKVCSENLELCSNLYMNRNVEALRGKLPSLENLQTILKGFLATEDSSIRGALISEAFLKLENIDPFLFELFMLSVPGRDGGKLAQFLSSWIERIKSHKES